MRSYRCTEIFTYWLQGGRIDLGFLGAAQIDRFANINTTVIGGTYRKPKVRLPGAGGAPEIAGIVRRGAHHPAAERAGVRGQAGFRHLRRLPRGRRQPARLNLRGKGPTAVITDLGILTPDPVSKELMLTSIHPGVTVDAVVKATGWPLKVAAQSCCHPAADRAGAQRAARSAAADR